MNEDLVMDIGMYDGADTAYYLHQGYSVVAVEANADTVQAAASRFRREIEEGRLRIEHVAIAPSAGMVDMRIDNAMPSHSRLASGESWQSDTAVDYEIRQTRGVTAGSLFDQYGVPIYLKVDIEGADDYCIEALDRIDLPKYVSFELDVLEVGRDPDQLLGASRIQALALKGYSRFKIVECATFRVLGTRYEPATAIDKAARFLLRSEMVRRLDRRLGLLESATYRHLVCRRLQYEFPFHSTGPWGADLSGRWVSADIAKDIYTRYAVPRVRRGSSVWCDCHATW